MQIIRAREFRTNQGKYLSKANEGQSIILSSRYGDFKIVPLSSEDIIASRIKRSMDEVNMMEAGIIPSKNANDFLNEL